MRSNTGAGYGLTSATAAVDDDAAAAAAVVANFHPGKIEKANKPSLLSLPLSPRPFLTEILLAIQLFIAPV